MSKKKEEKGLKFEEGMAALEEMVGKLESGELQLEEALKVFEDGVGLVRALNDKLTGAEQKIEILSRSDDGSAKLNPTGEEDL